MSKKAQKLNYKLPRLNDYKGDVTQRWYIIYYVSDREGVLQRKRVSSINNSFIKRERYADAAEVMKNITSLLKEGFTTSTDFLEDTENEGLLKLDSCTMFEALEWARDKKIETKRMSKSSVTIYRSHVNTFFEWIRKNRNPDIKLKNVTKKLMYDFLDHLITEKGLSDKTHNNYQINLQSLFQMIIKRHDGYTNPMTGMEKKSYVLPRVNKAFTSVQLETIRKEILKEGEAQLYLFCHFVFYCFIRPGELLRMKVKHVHPEMVELVGNPNTKIRYTNFREIPDVLNELIDKFGVRKRDPEEYLFMNAFTLGKCPVGVNFFKKRITPILTRLGFDSKYYGIYSFKHSGNIRMFEFYKDARKNMIQNGHTDIETTLIYLRDLGINIKSDLKDFK